MGGGGHETARRGDPCGHGGHPDGRLSRQSLATLQSALSKLAPNDRVNLVAFDLNATSLTQGFVAPNSAEMATVLKS